MKITTTLLLFLLALPAAAQPTLDASNRATFTFHHATARSVEVVGDDACEGDMRRKDNTWTLTTGPLRSDLYAYRFVIDGEESATDPTNPLRCRDIADTMSCFIVKGYPGSYYMDNGTEHGRIEKLWYPSSLNGMKQRRLAVYLPPQYDRETDRRFPVLYLLHGSGGDENAWTAMGRLAQIMDNMIAEGRCKPMVVVMPNGNVDLDAAPGESPYMTARPQAQNISSMMGTIERAFPQEVMAFVRQKLRIMTDKQHQAIAGLSLGGLHTLYIAANNPDEFDYVGLFSPQTSNALTDRRINSMQSLSDAVTDFTAALPFASQQWKDRVERKMSRVDNIDIYANIDDKLQRQFATPPRLYYIAVGEDDMIKKLVDRYRQKLNNIGAHYQYNLSSGAHTWQNWRRYLLDFLPQLF